MRFLFIVDPLESLKAYKDTSVTMMREAASRGHAVHVCEQGSLCMQEGNVSAHARPLEPRDDDDDWYRAGDGVSSRLAAFDAVVMRKDPPFDLEYVTSTWLLSAAERDGARIFNAPAAIRDHNEKLAILEFPRFNAPTLVTREPARVHAFIDEHRDTVIKRLDVMGGENIFRIRADDEVPPLDEHVGGDRLEHARGGRPERAIVADAQHRPACGSVKISPDKIELGGHRTIPGAESQAVSAGRRARDTRSRTPLTYL